MEFSKKNKTIYIDREALSTLALVQEGLLSPVTSLMDQETANRVNIDKKFQGVPFPFSFILAPNGEENKKVIKSIKPKEFITLISNNMEVGEIEVDDVFKIDPVKRLAQIYGTSDKSHPGVRNTNLRLGDMAISGKYKVFYPIISDNKKRVTQMIKKTQAKKVSAIMLASNPLNRAHERIIRQTLSSCDLLVIFLRKPFTNTGLDYNIRAKALNRFIDNYLPSNKVIVVPFENTYIFAGYNELILDAILAQNYGCDKLVIGKNHAGLGLYFDNNRLNTIFDEFKNIEIEIIDEFVYCEICNTLVNLQTCPHGQHHHIHYHSTSILKLLKVGMMPPSVLVRREVSASILSTLFPDRFEHLQELYDALVPNDGLMEEHSEEDFYIKLMGLYQTSSLT